MQRIEVELNREINILVPKLPSDLFAGIRAPKASQEILAEIADAPEKFGTETIRAALAYVAPELKDIPGMVRVGGSQFYERSPDGPWDNCFRFWYHKSFYDGGVITGAGLTHLGVRLPTETVLDSQLLHQLPVFEVVNSRSRPQIVVQDGAVLHLDSSVFREAELKLSQPNSSTTYHHILLSGQERRRESDGFLSLHVRANVRAESSAYGPFDTGRYEHTFDNAALTIKSFVDYKEKAGYALNAGKYRKASNSGVGLTIKNEGPAEFWMNCDWKHRSQH